VVSGAVAGCAGAGGSRFQAEDMGRVCRVVSRVVVERDGVIGIIVAKNSNRKTQSMQWSLQNNCPPTDCLSSPLPVSRSQLVAVASSALP